jgi:hypothetical protein
MDTHLKNKSGILNFKSSDKLLRALDKQIEKDKRRIILQRLSLIRKLKKINNTLFKITQL